MDESAVELPSNPGLLSHVPLAELNKESIVAVSNAIMVDDDTAQNTVSMDQAICGLKLVDDTQHFCPKDESAGKLHSEPGSLLCVPPPELSKESIVTELKTIMDDADANNIISMDQSTYGWQLVEELHRRDSVAEPKKETTSPNVTIVLDVDEGESATLNSHVTNTVHQRDDETGHSVPPPELSNNAIDLNAKESVSEHDEVEIDLNATFLVQLVEDSPQQDNKSVFIIPSVEACENLVVAELKPVLKDDEVENIVAETELQVGTASSEKEMIVKEEKVAEELHKQKVDCEAQKHEKVNLKLTLNKRRTEIAEELESLKAQTDQKLKKIDEIAKQEAVIDAEIAHMESRCNENKCKHAKFIDLFKLIAESQLPLRTHREIKLLIDKEDEAAQMFLSKALKLQIQIETRAKLKPTLQGERMELEKLLEALRLQMDQKLKEADEVYKLEEAVDSEITHIVPQRSETTLVVYTRSSRKRKSHDGNSAEKECSAPEVQAKRTTLDKVDSSLQERVHDGMVTDP